LFFGGPEIGLVLADEDAAGNSGGKDQEIGNPGSHNALSYPR
jgi:hypothetical protein